MHLLMHFVGCIRDILTNSDRDQVMKEAFGGVASMLTGKKFPQTFRALRMVTEGILRDVIKELDVIIVLNDKASQSRTTRLWIDCLITPTCVAMLYVRAEREVDWPFNLLTGSQTNVSILFCCRPCEFFILMAYTILDHCNDFHKK